MPFMIISAAPSPSVLDVQPGETEPTNVAKDADLRTDIPRYCVYRDGELAEEVNDITGEPTARTLIAPAALGGDRMCAARVVVARHL